MPQLRILLLSAGSLIGQNALDALEGRRHLLRVAGANCGAANPRLFRCDAAYLTPPSDDAPAFRARLRELIEIENPNLILAGRDHDIPFLGELYDAEPALRPRLPCGPRRFADIVQDKWESHLFCLRHKLPFADTLLTGPDADAGAASAFLARHGFPLIAKPRLGYGSIGTRVLFDENQFARMLRQRDYVVQPYLAPLPNLREKFFDLADGWPLFHALVDEGQYAGQAILGPDGRTVDDVWCHLVTHISGKPERAAPIREPEFEETTRQFARAFAAEGWRGPVNLQCRKVGEGRFVGFELGARMTGTTSARRLFGFDEIGQMSKAFAGVDLPLGLPPVAQVGPGFVMRSHTDYYAPDEWVRELDSTGSWHAR